jgi:predicted peroxiredoxin
MLQIGITNFPDERLKIHEKLGWELIELRGPMDGLIAREWETSILQMLKRSGAKLAAEEVAGKFDGYTEAWITESFAVNSLAELMQKVQDDE